VTPSVPSLARSYREEVEELTPAEAGINHASIIHTSSSIHEAGARCTEGRDVS
jgi:hypothetical protein